MPGHNMSSFFGTSDDPLMTTDADSQPFFVDFGNADRFKKNASSTIGRESKKVIVTPLQTPQPQDTVRKTAPVKKLSQSSNVSSSAIKDTGSPLEAVSSSPSPLSAMTDMARVRFGHVLKIVHISAGIISSITRRTTRIQDAHSVYVI
ncbi:hypothetical protein BGZ97_002652 [Linnemannia gamsii]|uniref:Uncharacterized protein n=1 Tax=Linnemannia gamsii TaxID=64522 RepID=A0A9P6QYF8_9FUNG|nr:hypothetical protein BGZ97_002652 [Linnemannia gamsii]